MDDLSSVVENVVKSVVVCCCCSRRVLLLLLLLAIREVKESSLDVAM